MPTKFEKGDCYYAAYTALQAVSTDPTTRQYVATGWRLIHGIADDGHGLFGHGWIEKGNDVFDPLKGSHIDRDDYYRVHKVSHSVRYTWKEAEDLAAHRSTFGCWDPKIVKVGHLPRPMGASSSQPEPNGVIFMSMCLAVPDGDQIHFSGERCGLPASGISFPGTTITTKVIELQPGIVLLCTGGMQHWADVRAAYQNQVGLEAAANQVRQILLAHTGTGNQAYGRVCGFVDGIASFVRLDRAIGQATIAPNMVRQMNGLVCVGQYPMESGQNFHEEINAGQSPKVAIKRAIERLDGLPSIVLPVDEMSISA